MFYPTKFYKGVFKKRYKRFFADIQVGDKTLTAHCPNTGSLKSCNIPDSPCYYSKADDPKRKLKQTLEAIDVGTSWVGIHTHKANKIVAECILPKHQNYQAYNTIFSEVKISDKSRVDFVLAKKENQKKPTLNDFKKNKYHIIEVKNVSLAEKNVAYFPDAVTTRGQKHILELSYLIQQGHTCELLFLIQRSDFKYFSPAEHIDPEYTKLLRQAYKNGLEINAYIVDIKSDGYHVRTKPAQLKI